MKKNRKFSPSKFLLFLLLLIIITSLILIGIYEYETSAISTNTNPKTIIVDEGDNYFTLTSKLKEKKLIRSEFFYKLYLKIAKPTNLAKGKYDLNEAMSVPEIVKVLGNKDNQRDSTIKLTFREGLTVKQIAKIVESKTGITEETFLNKTKDTNYLKTLQKDYWFLTDSIYNDQIYYPLEGYLFPDTYHFEDNKLTADNIIRKMLDNTNEKLTPYKVALTSGKYNIHQILTLSSIIELEAATDSDRTMVAGVLYNRLNKGWSLGCDITTYYAVQKSLNEKLTKSDLSICNGYNTRCTSMIGLPVGPINNPSLSSIKAAINPQENNYYYFVADTNKKVYFTKSANEHAQIISKLKKEGIWAA